MQAMVVEVSPQLRDGSLVVLCQNGIPLQVRPLGGHDLPVAILVHVVARVDLQP